MPAKVILNPYSNRWNAKKRWPEAEAALQEAGVEFSLAVSEHPRQPVDLAEKAIHEGYSPIIVAGGDGTIGDTINGIGRVKKGEHFGRIGIMPLGTANDFVHNLKMPLDLAEAAKVIAAGKTRPIDVCIAGDRFFINNAALGLEPYITVLQQEMTFLKGIPRYLAAAIKGIVKNPRWYGRVEWDDDSYEGPITLLSVGNAPLTGGLFYMAPHADPADGKLTAVLVNKDSSLSLLALLPKAMKPEGTFVNAPGVKEFHTTRISVELKSPSPAHSDGELFLIPQEKIEYGILPAMIDVIVP